MRPGGRAAAAAQVLDDMAARRRPASEALRDWGLSHRFAGAGDRAAIGNIVYDTLRRRASQAWRMDSEASVDLVTATLLGQWGHTPETLAAEFAGDPHAPALPGPERLAAWNSRMLADAPDHVRADVPQWCAAHLEAALGPDWVSEGQALACRPPLDLRANLLKAPRDKVLARLARFGPQQARHAPSGIRIPAGERGARLPNVQAEAAFAKGWFEVQDEGSQLAAHAAGAKAGEQVFDYCAGAGGKTLALAADMGNRGQVHAHDTDRMRLFPIYDRLKRAGAHNVQVLEPGADLGAHAGRMDCVLVDAPCTGSGVWRRHPDAKWRLDEGQLAIRMLQQDAVLAGAAALVKPGGRLVYATCSLFHQENAARVRAFLAARPDFGIMEPTGVIDALCKSAQCRQDADGMVTLTPALTGTDGFFIALLRRNS